MRNLIRTALILGILASPVIATAAPARHAAPATKHDARDAAKAKAPADKAATPRGTAMCTTPHCNEGPPFHLERAPAKRAAIAMCTTPKCNEGPPFHLERAAKPATPAAKTPGPSDTACVTPKCVTPPFTAGRAAVQDGVLFGNGRPPTQILPTVASVALGDLHGCAVDASHVAVCWGNNEAPQVSQLQRHRHRWRRCWRTLPWSLPATIPVAPSSSTVASASDMQTDDAAEWGAELVSATAINIWDKNPI